MARLRRHADGTAWRADTFPGFDEPSFKQPWDITLVVPKDDVAVANSSEAKTETCR
jgi:aminopeptidase N